VFGPIYIGHQPVLPLTIPQSPWWKGLGGSQKQIVEKQRTQRFDGWLIQGTEIATERGAMGQALATKERHKRLGERGEAFIKCL
jgi:hypothetical protein